MDGLAAFLRPQPVQFTSAEAARADSGLDRTRPLHRASTGPSVVGLGLARPRLLRPSSLRGGPVPSTASSGTSAGAWDAGAVCVLRGVASCPAPSSCPDIQATEPPPSRLPPRFLPGLRAGGSSVLTPSCPSHAGSWGALRGLSSTWLHAFPTGQRHLLSQEPIFPPHLEKDFCPEIGKFHPEPY